MAMEHDQFNPYFAQPQSFRPTYGFTGPLSSSQLRVASPPMSLHASGIVSPLQSFAESSSVRLVQDSFNYDHTNATLKQIDEVANRDLEMNAPSDEEVKFTVLDTNILIAHLDVIQQFVADIESTAQPVVVIIPGVVISELDYQKKGESKYLEWTARRASTWILKKLREKGPVRGQAHAETCRRSGNWKIRDKGDTLETNDGLIVDCCKYFARLPGSIVIACSADTNFCIEAHAQGIETISPTRYWSSREIAATLFGNGMYLGSFCPYRQTHHPAKVDALVKAMDEVVASSDIARDDDMEVDEDATMADAEQDIHPSHVLDDLHLQIIDHFTILLVELVKRVSGSHERRSEGQGGSGARSMHAPPVVGAANVDDWNARECIEYLVERAKSRRLGLASTQHLGDFLTKVYARGARRGQDWTKGDWRVSLQTLGKIGEIWGDGAMEESLSVLEPQFELAFETAMRPTGI